MRVSAGLLLLLFSPAAANTVSRTDFEQLSALIDRAATLTADVADAEAAIGSIAGPGYCLTLLRHDLQLATAEIRQLQSIVLISSRISNEDEERFAVNVLATAVGTSTSIVGALRSDIDGIGDSCRESTLVAAKAEQALRFLDEELNPVLSNLSRRLPEQR